MNPVRDPNPDIQESEMLPKPREAVSNGVNPGSDTHPEPQEAPLVPPPAPKRRILFLITKANWGGAQRYVFDLAGAVKTADYDVAVAYGEEGALAEKLTAAGIRTIALPSVERDVEMFSAESITDPKVVWRSVKREWHALMSLVRLLKEEEPDILHLNSSKAGGIGSLAGRLAGVPTIVFTSHGWAFNERRPWWQRLAFRFLYALTILLAHRTISVSEAVHKDIDWIPGPKLSVVKNGIDAPAFITREDARAKLLPNQAGKRWLGMVAELHPTKRIEDAIEALAHIQNEYPDTILVVLGEGALRTELEDRIRHYNLGERVFLLGFVPDAAIYMKAFDIFLMPSRSEALGLALVEAGYAGLPVIASRVGGIPEIVRHKRTGLLVPAENPHALVRALQALIQNPEEAHTYGTALEARIRERFSKERMIVETIAAYRR